MSFAIHNTPVNLTEAYRQVYSPAPARRPADITRSQIAEHLVRTGRAMSESRAQAIINNMSQKFVQEMVKEIREGFIDFNKGKTASGQTPQQKTVASANRKYGPGGNVSQGEKQYQTLSDKQGASGRKYRNDQIDKSKQNAAVRMGNEGRPRRSASGLRSRPYGSRDNSALR